MAADLPFESGPTALAFWAAYLLAFGPDLLRQLREPAAADGTVHDGRSKRVLGVSLGLSVLVAVVLSTAGVGTMPAAARLAVFWVGLATALLGTGVRWYAIRTLGAYFHSAVRVRDDHRIVDAGPYRWVRHPSYTGGSLMLVGVGLALTDWASLALVVLGVAVGYGYRIRVEERVLAAELGTAYRDYASRTPYRILPFVW